MYRYDTVLVNKAEGFHMADIGTELRILVPPQTCLAIQVSAIFFFCRLPKFPSCSHFVTILTRITHVLCTHSSEGLDPTMAHSRKDKAETTLGNQDSEGIGVIYAL